MDMKQRSGRMMKEWAIFGGLAMLLHVAFFAGIFTFLPATPADSLTPIWVITALYLIAGAALMVWFYRRLNVAYDPIEYREARERGIPANAKVLDIQQTRWRSGTSRGASASFTVTFRPFSIRPRRTKYEQRMHVRVSQPGLPDYEATVAAMLAGGDIPKKGATIAVKVHPQHPEIIVLDLDKNLFEN